MSILQYMGQSIVYWLGLSDIKPVKLVPQNLIAEHVEKAIETRFEKKVDEVGIDQRAWHRSPQRVYKEAGGWGVPKLVGFDPMILRAFARSNAWTATAVDIRCREVAAAHWDVVPDLTNWDREVGFIRKLIRSARKFPERLYLLDRYDPNYLTRKEVREIVEATKGPELTAEDVRHRFEYARLDKMIEAENSAAVVRKLIDNCNRNPMSSWAQIQRAVIQDFLIVGTLAIEKRRLLRPVVEGTELPRPDNPLVELLHVDAATVRPCFDEHGMLRGINKEHRDELAFEQWIDGRPVQGGGWRYCDLIWNIISPQTDIEYLGYGISPTEAIVITMMLDAWGDKEMLEEFKRGTKGMALAFKGAQFQKDMVRFEKMMFEQEIEGTHKTAFFGVGEDGDIKAIPLSSHTTGQDKRAEGARNLFKTRVAARFQMPIAKLTGESEHNTRATTDNQKDWDDDGLSALLQQWDETINHGIIRDVGFRDVKYISTPDHERDDKQRLENTEKRLTIGLYPTINHALEADDQEPIEGGDISLHEWQKYGEEKGRARGQADGQPADAMGGGMEQDGTPDEMGGNEENTQDGQSIQDGNSNDEMSRVSQEDAAEDQGEFVL